MGEPDELLPWPVRLWEKQKYNCVTQIY